MFDHHHVHCSPIINFILRLSQNFCSKKVTIFLVLLIISCLSEFNHAQIHKENIGESDVKYLSVDFETSIQKLLLTTSNQLFVGARNKFIKVDVDNLKIIQEFKIQILKDSPECPPDPEPCPSNKARSIMQADCKNLFPFNVSSETTIFACYSTNQGMCYIFRQSDLTKGRLIGSPSQVSNYVASRSSSFVVPVSAGNTTHIFVAHAYDGRPVNLSPPTLSNRKLVSSLRQINLDYSVNTKSAFTAIDLRNNYKTSFPLNYIYGFQDGDYVFFVKTEPNSLKGDRIVTKVARVCTNDYYFGSYSEIEVKCSEQTKATTAVIGKMDTYLRNTFADSVTSHQSPNALFISFENHRVKSQSINGHQETRVCAFGISKLSSLFDEAKRKCYSTRDGSMIESLSEPGSRCTENQLETCSTVINKFIKVPEPLDGLLVYGDRHRLTSLVSVLQGPTTPLRQALFVGTENGFIKKIVSGRDIFSVGISKSSIEPGAVVDASEENIFFASDKSLIKLPIKTCLFYQDCGSCIESLGPTAGGTVVKVKGIDLGFHDETQNTENEIKVAGLKCSIRSWNYTEIICAISGSTEVAKSGPIELKVKDISSRKPYDIQGSATSSEKFEFLTPSVKNVEPKYSPLAGGVDVFIHGENLDIGSNISIALANFPCTSIQIIDSSVIHCVAGPAIASDQLTGPVKIKIDSALIVPEINFSYLLDPSFSSISPNVTSATSGVNISVFGDHFDSLFKPRLVINAIVPRASSPLILESDCTLINASCLICPSPIMPSDISFEASIPATIAFANGGSDRFIQTDFILVYHPDPKFSNKIVTTQGNDGGRTLEIMGQHLSTGYGMRVLLVNQLDGATLECGNLRSIDNSLITCDIPLNDYPGDPTSSLWNISVIAGSKQALIGMVPIEPEDSSSTTIAGFIVGLIAILVVIALIMMYLLKRNGYLLSKKGPPPSLGVTFRSENGQFQRQGSQNEYHGPDGRISGQPLLFDRQSEEIKFVIEPQKQAELQADGILFSRDYLTREKVIGQGNFGLVFKGYLQLPNKEDKIKVAIKTLKTDRGILSQDKGEAFLAEGLIMKEFCHENVLSLIGVSIDFDGSPMIITPFMEHGDLRSYIQREDLEFTVIDLIQFGVQVAQGMVYLASLKFVHRDLAARNCMVDEHHTVKVADFGLSRDVYTTSYYSDADNFRKPLPRKWMAIESLERGNYDTKSDVWSYGVLLWELLTRGDIPYPDVDDWKMKDYLKVGYRLPRPEHCPPEVYSVMKECWVEDPKSRPTFEEILKLIEVAIESNEKKYLEQKTNRNIRYINDPSIFTNPHYDGSLVTNS
uniref:receptor protein-tyrosine kinase n=1 Tax=Tetranychus urticae TaxID=32264 RepID=T1K210_TETUR